MEATAGEIESLCGDASPRLMVLARHGRLSAMKKERIAAQIYSVRDYCNDAHDLAETLGKVRSLGYVAVQLSSLGPLPPHELARVLKDQGLTCCSTHEDSEELLTDPESVIERLNVLGCTATAYPYPKDQDFTTQEGVRRLCKALNRDREAPQEGRDHIRVSQPQPGR